MNRTYVLLAAALALVLGACSTVTFVEDEQFSFAGSTIYDSADGQTRVSAPSRAVVRLGHLAMEDTPDFTRLEVLVTVDQGALATTETNALIMGTAAAGFSQLQSLSDDPQNTGTYVVNLHLINAGTLGLNEFVAVTAIPSDFRVQRVSQFSHGISAFDFVTGFVGFFSGIAVWAGPQAVETANWEVINHQGTQYLVLSVDMRTPFLPYQRMSFSAEVQRN